MMYSIGPERTNTSLSCQGWVTLSPRDSSDKHQSPHTSWIVQRPAWLPEPGVTGLYRGTHTALAKCSQESISTSCTGLWGRNMQCRRKVEKRLRCWKLGCKATLKSEVQPACLASPPSSLPLSPSTPILDFSPPELWEMHFYCFSVTQSLIFCHSSPCGPRQSATYRHQENGRMNLVLGSALEQMNTE